MMLHFENGSYHSNIFQSIRRFSGSTKMETTSKNSSFNIFVRNLEVSVSRTLHPTAIIFIPYESLIEVQHVASIGFVVGSLAASVARIVGSLVVPVACVN